MDTVSIVSSLLALQAGNLQSQIATSILKSNADAEKSAVQTLLGGQSAPSTANLGPGVGGNLNITA
jgi:Putative motility protein